MLPSLPPAQREGYLKAVCGDDEALLARMHVLLEADEQTNGPLAEPAILPPRKTVVIAPPPGEKPGDRIGHYKILQLIGEGKDSHDIAGQLHLSFKTVDAHRGKLKEKLNLKSGTELICYAARWVESQHAVGP